jgi:hypothetical protein
MIKVIILAMLLPIAIFAQSESKTTYIIDANHLKDCRGGTGRCIGTDFELSLEKTTASIARIDQNRLQMRLDRTGFSGKEWEELLETKTFSVDDESTKVNSELLRILEIDQKLNTIKRAVYPVLVFENKAIITLQLVESH